MSRDRKLLTPCATVFSFLAAVCGAGAAETPVLYDHRAEGLIVGFLSPLSAKFFSKDYAEFRAVEGGECDLLAKCN